MSEWYSCLGCVLKHLMTARTLISESLSFHSRGKMGMADEHLMMALGELREAEKHSGKWPEISGKIAEVRKQLESGMIYGEMPSSDVMGKLMEIGAKALKMLRERPELCPTCVLKPVHVASHEA